MRQYPGREKELWEMFRNNPEAIASIRAPLIENKVTDYILALAKVTDKKVSREELYRERRRRKGWPERKRRGGLPKRNPRGLRLRAPC